MREIQLVPELVDANYWDLTLLNDLLVDESPRREVIVIPGAKQVDLIDDISMELAQYPKVLVVVTSDEENLFPIEKLYHPDMQVYVMYPRMERHRNVDGFMPQGYAPFTRRLVKESGMGAKSLDWLFAGQVTHQSRRECVEALRGLSGGKLIETEGFTQGLKPEEYTQYMCRAKIIPCPGGPNTPESFRFYEALEAGCIPIPENRIFWTMMFGEVPFPIVENWNQLPELINHYKDRPDVNNECQAWWQCKKRELRMKLIE